MEKLLNKYKSVTTPILIIFILVAATIGVGSFLANKINEVNAQIALTQGSIDVLEARLGTLQSLAPDIKTNVNIASQAVPEDNPSILAVRQLRSIAVKWNVVIVNMTVDTLPPTPEEILIKHDVNFELLGEYQNVVSFLNNLASIVPLLNLQTMDLDSSADNVVKGLVKVQAYSANFPEELPSLTEPLASLSAGEQETLNAIDDFEILDQEFIEPSGGAEVVPRENPFSL